MSNVQAFSGNTTQVFCTARVFAQDSTTANSSNSAHTSASTSTIETGSSTPPKQSTSPSSLSHFTATPKNTKTRTHSLHILSTADATHIASQDRPPAATPPPFTHHQPQTTPLPSHHTQSPVVIAIEVLAGLAVLTIAFFLARCYISYRRTPSRDRVASLIHRHQLQREMEEMERNPADYRRSYGEPPPPPYFPRPPSYDVPTPSTPQRATYVPVGITSPASTPPSSPSIRASTPIPVRPS